MGPGMVGGVDPNASMVQALSSGAESSAQSAFPSMAPAPPSPPQGGMAGGAMLSSGVGTGATAPPALGATFQGSSLTKGDLEHPLAYTRHDWQPQEGGGWFTTRDLYSRTPGDIQGNQGPSGMLGTPPPRRTSLVNPYSLGENAPSTNNWQLVGRGPGWIMRNGFPIQYGSGQAKAGLPWGIDMRTGMGEQPRRGQSPGLALGVGLPAYYETSAGWPGGEGWMNVWGHPPSNT